MMWRVVFIALLLASSLGGCKVERIVARSAFACSAGGPCPIDASTEPDVGVPERDAQADDAFVDDTGSFADADEDAGLVDAVNPDAKIVDVANADARPADTGAPDATDPDTGVPPDTGVSPDAGAIACFEDADCPRRAEVCWEGVCRLGCDSIGGLDCTALGGRCDPVTGRCQGVLSLGDHCVRSADCDSALCLGFNLGGQPWRVCSSACSRTSNCPLDFSCERLQGMSFCLHESTVSASWDTPSGAFCDANMNTCQSGWCFSAETRCLETCSKESDCTGFGGNCFTFVRSTTVTFSYENLCLRSATSTRAVGTRCAVNEDCASGVCDRDTLRCAIHCCSEADCSEPDETCSVYALSPTDPIKICKPRGLAGMGRPGDACTQATDCDTGLCAPVDPSNPIGARKCTSFCCENADCAAALPMGGVCQAAVGPVVPQTIVGQCTPN